MNNIFEKNIADLYQQVFGTKPTNLSFNEAKEEGNENGKSLVFEAKKTTNKTSSLGTPLYESSGLLFGREYFLPAYLGGVLLPHAVMRIQGKKTIVETPMVNRKGSVKELISIDDYSIKVRGFFIDDEFPDAGITQLKKWHETTSSISLRSALSDVFLTEDDKVVIKGFDMPEMKGAKGVRAYELDLVSDQEFSLIVE